MATTVRDRGKCIGCGLCVQNCPFKVPRLAEDKKATSCKYCIDRVQNNLTPACAKTCPSGAIQFGERDNLINLAKERVSVLGGKANLYGETQSGGLGVIYILKDSPDVYGLPTTIKAAEASSLNILLGPFGKVAFLGSLIGLAMGHLNKVREERLLRDERR